MKKLFNWIFKSEVSLKILFTVIDGVIVFIPVWIFLFVRWRLGPQDFWENMAVIVVAGIFLSTLQLALLIFGVIFLASIWKA